MQNVDKMFLKEAPVDTPTTTKMTNDGKTGGSYENFTYTRPEMSIKNNAVENI